MFEIRHYVDVAGRDLLSHWLDRLRNRHARVKIIRRVDRLAAGHFGDCKPVREGIWELRIDAGPGYRLYYSQTGRQVILLLCGGDKRKQNADIERAVSYWRDYQQRNKS